MSDHAVGQHATISGFRERIATALMLSGGLMLALVVSAMSPVAHDAAAYFAGKGDGDLVAQMIVTVPSVGIILGGPLSGWLVGRLGAKVFLLGALGIFGVAGSAGLYLDAAMGLLVSRFVLGLATSGIVTAMITLIGDYFTPDARARVLGYQSATGALSGVAALLGAGQLGELAGWRAPFSLYLLAFPVLLLGLHYLPATPRVVRARDAAPVVWSGLFRLWPIYLMIIPMFIAVYMPNIQVSFLLRDDGISRPIIQSYVILSGAFTVAVGALAFGRIRHWLSTGQILLLCFALQGSGLAIMGVAHGAALTAAGCAVLGFGTGIANPLISDLIVAWSTLETRGLAVGVSYTFRYAGDFINPLVMYPLGVALGLHRAFIVVGVLFLAGVAVAAAMRSPGIFGKPGAKAA